VAQPKAAARVQEARTEPRPPKQIPWRAGRCARRSLASGARASSEIFLFLFILIFLPFGTLDHDHEQEQGQGQEELGLGGGRGGRGSLFGAFF
jgi:hypothetical protein